MRVGLTGGIGSGKSTVASILVGLGATLVDTDAISRSMTLAGGPAIPFIASTFGEDFIAADGSMDRARMRETVFADPAAKRKLEAILHPLIGAECERQAERAEATRHPIVFDVPLLVESKRWRAIVDRVLVVDADAQTQVARVIARSGWSEDAVRAVVAQQASRPLRRAAADAVIYNDGLTLEMLSSEVEGLWSRWVQPVTR